MADLSDIIKQLITERDRLNAAIATLESVSNGASHEVPARRSRVKRIVSAASRAKMRLAQKARWAKVRGQTKPTPKLTLVKRTMSASGRRRIAAAQRARWAKVRAKKH